MCFSDEKYFTIAQGNKRGWCKPGAVQPYYIDGGRFEAKSMMWLGITLKGLTHKVWFEGTKAVDADTYFQTIRDGFYIASEDGTRAPLVPILMQDNAPAHGHIKEQFDKIKDIFKPFTLMAWPPRSPDLNPIENLWAWLDKKKRKAQVKFRNVDDMHAWFDSFMRDNMEEIMTVVTNNILSFYGRLKDVIDSKGEIIRY